MASSNNNETISRASLHTQKKFELIEKYIMPWAQKLMNNPAVRAWSLLTACAIAVFTMMRMAKR